MLNSNKILAISMLVSLTAPVFFLVAFFIQQQLIQDEIKEQMKYATLQTIGFKKSGFKGAKKDKEIHIEGKVFDAKSITINKNKIFETGIFDDNENELEKNYSPIIHVKEDEPAPVNKLINKFLLPPPSIRNSEAFTAWLIENGVPFFGNYVEALTNQSYQIKTLPPIT